jgi:hypothetical protein
MRDWHADVMTGLGMPDPGWAGGYRGEGAAKQIGVGIGGNRGVAPDEVAAELARFEDRLARVVARLDDEIGKQGADTDGQLSAVIMLCAWAHGEWSHPSLRQWQRAYRAALGELSRHALRAAAIRQASPPSRRRLRDRGGDEHDRRLAGDDPGVQRNAGRRVAALGCRARAIARIAVIADPPLTSTPLMR